MKWIARLLALLVVVAIVGAIAIVATGNTIWVLFALTGPSAPFDAASAPAAPDYADPVSWAALPQTDDLADLVPEGIAPRAAPAAADVFFIHPTGYINAATWNSAMEDGTITEDNTRWMMANQASAYNGCCEVYAPRYREAAIHAFFADEETRDAALGLAYGDVERAFDHFLEHFSQGRPFIIASHSQGSHHAFKLLQQRIDTNSALRERMIAAYAIGLPAGVISVANTAALKTIEACDGPADLHCLIHFATYPEGAFKADPDQSPMICTNPVSWENDGARAEADRHVGAVLPSGRFTISPLRKDLSKGVEFAPLATPIPHLTWAGCENGALLVANQKDGPFDKGMLMGGTNYHGLDYPLFYMDIRENAIGRVSAYLAGAPR